MKNSFILYVDQEDIVKKLPNEQAGILLKTIFEYARTGKIPELDLVVDVAFTPFKNAIDANKKKYEETCNARAIAGSKGGKQKVANASKSKQNLAKGSKQNKNVANVADTDTDTDIDTDIWEREIYKEKSGDGIEPKKSRTFCKPTIDEIKIYCLERNNGVDYQHFYDFYESKGWMVGKNKMKDWKACVRTWERNKTKPVEETQTSNPFLKYMINKEGEKCQNQKLLGF